MGLSPFRSRSTVGSTTPVQPPNPDPRDYRLIDHLTVNGFLIVRLHYAGCINFEGEKILVFDQGVTMDDLERQGWIDPHFDRDGHHPIARFIPTGQGWEWALEFCQNAS